MPTERKSKAELVAAISEKSNVPKKEVSAVLDALNEVVIHELSKDGPGEVVIPSLLKLNVVVKPAVPEREGVNPFTKQPTVFKAKPERRIVKARVLKDLRAVLGEGAAPKDDLEIIEGIGPKIARAFRKAHISTFKQLAGTDVERLRTILRNADLAADPTTWPQQAQLAADGKMDELKKLQDELTAGRQTE